LTGSKSSKYVAIAVALLVVLATVGVIYYAVRHNGATSNGPQAPVSVPKPAEEKPAPTVDVQGAEIEQKGPTGKLEWKVKAGGKLSFDKDNQRAEGKNVKFQIIQADKSPVVVEAPVFEADYKNKKLIFTEGVKGELTNGLGRFSVARLEYDFATRKLLGSGGVQFYHMQYKAVADQIVVDTTNKKVRLRGGVRFARSGP
jgi:hypothetical protein